MFIPSTKAELEKLGWVSLDVLLVTGDAHIDNPAVGVSVIGHVLMDAGYKVGLIPQPDTSSETDIRRLGEPRLFWGITSGCVDSMVANHTASGKKRKSDDFTPGGVNDRRPDRAVIAYCNLIRRHFKNTSPLVIGGIEASLRRFSHYDFWSDKIRKSILFDAKADYLVHGMGERTVLELASALNAGKSPKAVRGLCFEDRAPPSEFVQLPPHEVVEKDKNAFIEMFKAFHVNNDPVAGRGLRQEQLPGRHLVQNPPRPPMTTEQLDHIHSLPYQRRVHPIHSKSGEVRANHTIQFSVRTHRGCYGGCNFCSIAVHQGRHVTSRSRENIVEEVRRMTKHPMFKGVVTDVGGPTANMYGLECQRKLSNGACSDKRCLFPTPCPNLSVSHRKQIDLLRSISSIPGVRKVFIASGIRHDLIQADNKHGEDYLREVAAHHVSGQLKIAPEHVVPKILELMGKPSAATLREFKKRFDSLSREAGKKQFLTYYLIAAHPGCDLADMETLRRFCLDKLGMIPEQIQLFTPTPSTFSTLMYHTGVDPFTGKKIFVERSNKERQRQRGIAKYMT